MGLEQYETSKSRPSKSVQDDRRRLNSRLIRWIALALLGLSIFIFGHDVYMSESLIFYSGIFMILAILVGTAGFVVDGIALWATYSGPQVERTETRRMRSETAPVQPRVRPGRQRSAGQITLSTWEFEAHEWRQIVQRLKGQEWRFNRDVFVGIVPNITRASVWKSIQDDWVGQGYLYRDGRSHWVRKSIRRQMQAPPAPRVEQSADWLLVSSSDNDNIHNN